MRKFNEVEQEYKKKQLIWKTSIRFKETKWKRFWAWIWYYIAFPWVWIWTNIKDWRTAVVFLIVCAVISSEVWVPYLIAFIGWNNEVLRNTMLGVASACWLFWIGPGTPFLVICISITIGTKALLNKIKEGRHKCHAKNQNQKVKNQEEENANETC